MKKKVALAGSVLLAAALAGCASSEVPKSDAAAADACGTEVSANSGKANFDRQRTGEPWQATGDELFAWQEFAQAASVAAEENPKYAQLEDAATTVYLKKKKAVKALGASGYDANSQGFLSLFSKDDYVEHYDALEMWRYECTSLVDRYNSQ